LSAAARSLNSGKVMRMSDRGAENVFPRRWWPQTDSKPVCPNCDCQICYDCPRSANQPRWRCKACRADFSVTSGTLFAWHKLSLKSYLMAIAMFCNEVKGKSMLVFSRDLDVQYKTAFVLAHKLREATASSMKALRIGGEGQTAEIDGAYFGAMSGRRTWRLIGLTAGSPSTSRANARLLWRCVIGAAVRWRRCSRPRPMV
jgi:transposase-like protein